MCDSTCNLCLCIKQSVLLTYSLEVLWILDMMDDFTAMKFYDLSMTLTTCPICLDTFVKPKTLPCLHTFCLDCLTSHYKSRQGMISIPVLKCPECREVYYVSNNDVSQFPTDFRLLTIVKLINSVAKSRNWENWTV